ncbi:MAG: hypothetical protein DWI26_00740, partial [Planctomycetota bacterium]
MKGFTMVKLLEKTAPKKSKITRATSMAPAAKITKKKPATIPTIQNPPADQSPAGYPIPDAALNPVAVRPSGLPKT